MFCGGARPRLSASSQVDSSGRLVRRSERSERRTQLFTEADVNSLELQDTELSELEKRYQQLIAEAQQCVGHGAAQGAFPEEWDAQLFVDCGLTAAKQRLVIFCPDFLLPIIEEPDELDRAFRFMLLKMDAIAMNHKYVVICCCLDIDWNHPHLSERLRVAFDILPKKYTKNLKCLHMLHANSATHMMMWAYWAWLSNAFWRKVQFAHSIEQICEAVYPDDDAASAELRRRFPQVVQHVDAEQQGEAPPVSFGVPLRTLCNGFGVDFTDKTTGRWYPKLPPTIIFLCEAIERDAADEEFGKLFDADAASIFSLLDTIDKGKPLGRDLDPALLWCALKVWLDCLPSPLLSFEAMNYLQSQGVRPGDFQSHREFLVEVFTKKLPEEVAYVALYLASFLHTMVALAQERHDRLVSGLGEAGQSAFREPTQAHTDSGGNHCHQRLG
eukprot:TRINITY_DN16134_c0_g2_i2.p1 TRINITY_DN16134_c0_g2~~TRINITY_DN16134_c0_g2_i2.p1  ORF type:complete len:442 (-),score=88.86 TRINITY_DN16134_c0_g2_i2:83-1408(-)